MPGDPEIREMQQDDAGDVSSLIYLTIDACYPMVYPARAIKFFKKFHSEGKILERQRTGDILVIQQDHGLIATGTTVDNEIFGVFVHPDFQQRGHGAAIMRELERRARVKGCTEAVISVSIPAKQFYRNLGYGSFADRCHDLGNGEKLAFWEARKIL